MAKRARFSKGYFSSNWASLPDDLLNSIVEKLFYLPDYISFSAVCKSWNSIASNHKENQIKLSNHQLPWLLTSSAWSYDECETMFSLYNYTTQLISNFQFRIPKDCIPYCFGSSHGWLFFMTKKSSLIVLNPLFGTIIDLPPLKKSFNRASKNFILSRNPSLRSFEVLAVSTSSTSVVLAYLKFGDEFWTYPEEIRSYFKTRSFTFYKNRILCASSSGQLHSIDVIGDTTSRRFKIRKIVAANIKSMRYSVSYLVETTKSDLLMVLRCSNCECRKFCRRYRVYKLVELDGKFERVLVTNLDGHCLFLGTNRSISVLASNYPGCNANSIYCSFCDWQRRGDYSVEEFNLEDQSVREDTMAIFSTACWIMPSMKQ